MLFHRILCRLAAIAVLAWLAACGTPPVTHTEPNQAEQKVVAAEAAASADPGYRVRGTTGLLDLGLGIF